MAIVVLESNRYNMMHGVEPTADMVLTTLGFDHRQIARFRDAYVTYRKDTPQPTAIFVVLTRMGGDNRVAHAVNIDALRQHPDYVNDHDDEFDGNFALFYYKVAPAQQAQYLAYLNERGAPRSLREKGI